MRILSTKKGTDVLWGQVLSISIALSPSTVRPNFRLGVFFSHEIRETLFSVRLPWGIGSPGRARYRQKGKHLETKKAFPEDEIYRAFAECRFVVLNIIQSEDVCFAGINARMCSRKIFSCMHRCGFFLVDFVVVQNVLSLDQRKAGYNITSKFRCCILWHVENRICVLVLLVE